MMGGGGMMGGIRQPQNQNAEMPISVQEAAKYAQEYLKVPARRIGH